MRLNKFLAQAGIASRRESDRLIQSAMVTVNGVIEDNPAYQVQPNDDIFYDNQRISIQSNTRIILLNKPDGYITTMKDPLKRKTVMDLVHTDERLFPIGRLDKDTTGLLLLTNDGQLANKLMHPSNNFEREYAVRVYGTVSEDALKNLLKGVELEDGVAKFKSVKYAGGEGTNSWYHVVLTEGRNREVRRLWNSQGVDVSRLIRVRYANIHMPKYLGRGQYQELTSQEVDNFIAKV